MGGVYACQTRSQAAAGSGSQQAHENHQQQDRNALEEYPPLHQLVGPPRVTIPDEADESRDQHPQSCEHPDPDEDSEKTVHRFRMGCWVPIVEVGGLSDPSEIWLSGEVMERQMNVGAYAWGEPSRFPRS